MKPTIILFGPASAPNQYFSDLEKKYSCHYFPLDYSISPNQQVELTAQYLTEKNITADGIIGLYDAHSILASLLCAKLKKPGTSPLSIYKAQHKGIFTRIIETINPDQPHTRIVDRNFSDFVSLQYPLFIKPVKGSMSVDAYLVSSAQQLQSILKNSANDAMRNKDWFQLFFDNFPGETEIPMDSYILQPYIKEKQYTVDGFVFNGQVFLLGFTESVYNNDHTSFDRFDFPAEIVNETKEQIKDYIQQLVSTIGYDNAGFNIEFFLTSEQKIIFIEMNTRISSQFIPLMAQWYTETMVEMMVKLSLGQMPSLTLNPHRLMASSCVLRRDHDHLIRRVPSAAELDTMRKQFDVIDIHILGEVGKKLSEYRQDAYTYRYAFVNVTGTSVTEIKKKLTNVRTALSSILLLDPVS